MKVYNTNLIKLRHTYLLEEIALKQKVHIRTVRAWIKEGLKIVEGLYPYLVLGYDLKNFLKAKRTRRKCKLNHDEFWCVKCRTARKSLENKVEIKYSGMTIGNNLKEFVIQGKCEICGTKLNRFSNESKLFEVKNSFNIICIKEAQQEL